MARRAGSVESKGAKPDRATTGARSANRSLALDLQPVLPAYRQVSQQIRGLILRGKFRPGERLPVEADFATMFGVSRSTIREALRVLSSDHLVETTRGVHGGSFVVQPNPARIAEHLESSLGLLTGAQTVTLHDLLEAREILEVRAAALAAERRTEDDLVKMRLSLPGGHDDVTPEERMEILAGSLNFHQLMLNATHNPLLTVMTRPIFRVLETRFLRNRPPDEFWVELDHSHNDVLAAIEAHDAAAAADAMSAHLVYLRSVYEAIDREYTDR